jgi:hypothetical protein
MVGQFAKSLMTDNTTGVTPAAMDAFVSYVSKFASQGPISRLSPSTRKF